MFFHVSCGTGAMNEVMSALENMANLGTSVNSVTYFYAHMHYNLSDSANMLTNYMGTAFLLSLVGAFISHAYFTRSKTLLLFGAVEFLVSALSLSLSLSSF